MTNHFPVYSAEDRVIGGKMNSRLQVTSTGVRAECSYSFGAGSGVGKHLWLDMRSFWQAFGLLGAESVTKRPLTVLQHYIREWALCISC